MAETLISPGYLTRENDQSQITQLPLAAGAAFVGPTVKGPVNIPTIVRSYSDYVDTFGGAFISGGQNIAYLTTTAIYNYFQNGGQTALVTRVVSGTYTSATASIANSASPTGGTSASAAFSAFSTGFAFNGSPVVRVGVGSTNYFFYPTSSGTWTDDTDGSDQIYYYASGSNQSGSFFNLVQKINTVSGLSGLVATTGSTTATSTVLIFSGSAGFNGTVISTGSSTIVANHTTQATLSGGIAGTGATAFVLETISQGAIMNSSSSLDSNQALATGSRDNVRWEVATSNTSSGTFTLLVRRGDDTNNNKVVLETFRDLSLDPNADNFISKVIGDQNRVLSGGQIVTTGTYLNTSRYVRVKSVTTTPNYFDNSGNPRSIYSASLPVVSSGSFGGAVGSISTAIAMYDQVTTGNIQGLAGSDYDNILTLLANRDDYKYNILSLPGLTLQNASTQLSTAAINTQNRGDAILIVDPSNYGESQTATINRARSLDNSYAATYWPWLRIVDPAVGKQVWVPAGTLIPGVYAYSDKVSAPWFAPAGLNRGALSNVLFVERKLTSDDRDALYTANVNPIATFPNNPVVVYGQKTLQKKASALDRVNVRRLLIELKSYIGQIANTLVFEQNSDATRLSFLGRVNPYLQNIQQRQGLYAFRVVMDETNNTADIIDRNQLVGQIYIQPTRTAEFVILDFNVLPTGATFPS